MSQALLSRAYGAAQQVRSLREQEADVFRRVNYSLKAALTADTINKARAISDNRRLWLGVEAALSHPANQLPAATRQAILRLGRAIQHEMDNKQPDISFLVEMNDQIIAGLSGNPG